jgi:hypothetical protein
VFASRTCTGEPMMHQGAVVSGIYPTPIVERATLVRLLGLEARSSLDPAQASYIGEAAAQGRQGAGRHLGESRWHGF